MDLSGDAYREGPAGPEEMDHSKGSRFEGRVGNNERIDILFVN
jgi:hypothetical protein